MRTIVSRVCVIAAIVAVFGTSASVFAQAPQSSSAQLAASAPQVRRLTVDEAVGLALENNLGIRIARIDPQIQDLNVLGARAGWAPSFSSTFQSNSSDAPNQNFLAGAQGGKTSNDQFNSNLGLLQTLRWGGRYSGYRTWLRVGRLRLTQLTLW